MTKNCDLTFLLNFCDENDITLLKDYSEEKINLKTKIEIKCINCEKNYVTKSLKSLIEYKVFKCIECLRKYNYQYLLSFCEKNNIILLKDYKDENVNAKTIVEAQCKNCIIGKINKPFQSFERYVNFNCNKCTNINKRNKTIETFILKYGAEHHMKTDESKEKLKQSNIEKYGVEHALQSEVFKEKAKQTCLKKFGVTNAMLLNETKEKVKKTCLEKYGVSNPMLLNETKEKIKETCLEKYGVSNSMQNSEIAKLNSIKSLHTKNYLFPSGKMINVQGYEPYGLDELLQNYDEKEILTGVTNVPEIWYEVNGKYKRHFVDIYIPHENRCIEIKSTWTFNKKDDYVLRKQKAGKYLGFNYEIWVYDNKKNKIIF